MTDQNNAAQAVPTDWSNGLAVARRAPLSGLVVLESATVLAIDALLSKLRAPVADETQAPHDHDLWFQEYGQTLGAFHNSLTIHTRAAWVAASRQYAALAGAPVAGYIKPDPAAPTHPRYVSELKYRSAADAEADPEGKGWLKVYAAPQASEAVSQPLIARALDEWHEDDGPVTWWAWCGHEWAGEAPWNGTPLDQDWPGYHTHWTPITGVPAALPAPQASAEPKRILFPTHLRKMWSGGEVQAWLDEYQGVTAPKPSAKGSLERYRQWQANQASVEPTMVPIKFIEPGRP